VERWANLVPKYEILGFNSVFFSVFLVIDGVAVLEKFEWPRALRFHLQQELRRKLHGAINKQEHLEPEGLHDDGHNSVLHKKEEPAELDVQVIYLKITFDAISSFCF